VTSLKLKILETTIADEKLRSILQVALRAPSGDNCQPWRFKWDGKTLHLSHDEERGRHALNRDNHASYLALGCLLESIEIQASTEGYGLSYELLPGPSPRAAITFGPSRERDPLAKELPRRFTDRRPFRRSSLNAELTDALIRSAERNRPTRLHLLTQVPPEFTNFLCGCEEIVWRERNYHRDLFEWIRFDEALAQSSRDGMPWRTLGVSYPESRMLQFCKNFGFQRVMNQLGFILNIRQLLRRQIASSAALYCITVSSDEPNELVLAGRTAMRAWLTLGQNGFGVQPLTLGSLSIYDYFTGSVPKETPPRFMESFAAGRSLYQKTFGLQASEVPVWLFRTGLSRGRSGVTLRLDIDRIFDSRR